MISIHLRRTGAKKDAHYRVVVADSRAQRDGAFIEVLGHYHPRFEPAQVTLDVQKVKAWMDKGAQPSDTVKSLLKKVEVGAVATAPAVSPSRQRDAVKHAGIRAAAPKPEPEAPEPAAEAAADDAAEAGAAAASDDAAEEIAADAAPATGGDDAAANDENKTE